MKKIILSAIALAITSVSFGQTDSTMRKQDPPAYDNKTNDGMNQKPNSEMNKSVTPRSYSDPNSTDNPNQTDKIPDGYIMQNGKMMAVKNGNMAPMNNDITLANGVTIMKNGNYTMKGGDKIMLKEGELIDMTGNLVSIKRTPPKN